MNRQTGSIFISRLLPRFHREYPHVMLDIAEADSNEAKRLLTNGEVDIAIFCTTNLNSSLLNLSSLYTEEMMLILPPDHPANRNDVSSLPLSALAGSPFILYRQETNFRQMINQIFSRNQFQPDILCEINNFFAVGNLVAEGAGISFMPKSMTQQHAGYRAYSIDPPETYRIALGLHKSTRPNESM